MTSVGINTRNPKNAPESTRKREILVLSQAQVILVLTRTYSMISMSEM